MDPRKRAYGIEWPTVSLIALTYGAWFALTYFSPALGLLPTLILLIPTLVLHSSLQHEATHGHPFPNRALSEAIMTPGLGLVVPYGRFRDLHLAHHQDANLTDPYDDPESNYFDPAHFWQFSRPVRVLLVANNTLMGRLFFGPLIGTHGFFRTEWQRIAKGEPGVLRDWLIHGATVVPVLAYLVLVAHFPVWAYLIACYAALSILKIRTFVEHQAHLQASGRSVIIEDRGPLAFLFLNNNLHSVHHAHPKVAWYDLPALYRSRRDDYLRRNRGYRFDNYFAVARRYMLRTKDPVPHPLSRAPE